MIRQRRGRIFGIINIIDFICLLTAVLVIAAGYWQWSARAIAVSSDTDNLKFRFYMRELPRYVADNVKIGDAVKDMTDNVELGFVTAIDVGPSNSEGITDDGVFVTTPKPGYSSLYITVESPGRINNKGMTIGTKEYYLVKTYDIFVGQSAMSGRLYETAKVR